MLSLDKIYFLNNQITLQIHKKYHYGIFIHGSLELVSIFKFKVIETLLKCKIETSGIVTPPLRCVRTTSKI